MQVPQDGDRRQTPTPRNPGPHNGSLMGNEQVSGPKRTGGVGVGALYRSQSRVPPPTDWRSPILLNVGSDQANSNGPPPSISKGCLAQGGERIGWPTSTRWRDFRGCARYFAKTAVRFQPGFNRCHALRVRVHVPFSNISSFQISILGSSWNINEEIRRLVEAPPEQVMRISRFQLCHGVRHFQIEVHLPLRRHFKCLPEFLLKDLELHRG